MNTELLIDAIVRQTTVLIAQLATSKGARTPLADVAEQVFGELAQELHRQAQEEVLGHFHRDNDQIVRSVLADLTDSGLVFRSGRGTGSTYRAATPTDLDHSRSRGRDDQSTDTLVWAVVYRLGPVGRSELASHLGLPAAELGPSLERLIDAKKILRTEAGTYRAHGFVVPLDEPRGWEAAVFDHFQAVVATICQRLAGDADAASLADRVGGSTFTFEVWPGHPLENEVVGELGRFRKHLTELRARVVDFNRSHPVPHRRSKVVVYGGQSILEQEDEETDDGF